MERPEPSVEKPTEPSAIPSADVLPAIPAAKQHEYAEIIRSMSQHEDALVNNRFTWFSTLQGLLFAALAFIWKESNLIGCCLVGIICLLGGVVAFSTRRTIRHADAAHDNLRDWWQHNLPEYTGPGRTGTEVAKPNAVVVDSKTPWNNVPTAFMGVWALIFLLFSVNLSISWSGAKKAAPTIVSIQATQATIDIQQSQQPAKQVVSVAPASADAAPTQRASNQKSPALSTPSASSSPPK